MKLLVVIALLAACGKSDEKPSGPAPTKIRVAIVGGMTETGFWQALSDRYTQLTGNTIEIAATGPKPIVISAFRKGGIDLIAVHASDAMINLVADGLAVDPQPWLRNDLVFVGPAADPAGIKGEKDALVALKKIIDSKSKLVVHASNGADGVLHDLREEGELQLDPANTIMFSGERQQMILKTAAAEGAYTLVGRIPVITGKLEADGIVTMVQGDPRLRRPYLVELSPTASAAAKDLAQFMRSRETQAWIATFGKGKYDDQPLFYPVATK
jgi:tungstate transport system substrate-binding protein